MNRLWTILGVSDVRRSFMWYLELLGLPTAEPAHEHFAELQDTDGSTLLALHRWGDHSHPSLMSPDDAIPGNGLLLFFRVSDFDGALGRSRSLTVKLEEEPHVNANTRSQEFSLRDPDGYYVTINAVSRA